MADGLVVAVLRRGVGDFGAVGDQPLEPLFGGVVWDDDLDREAQRAAEIAAAESQKAQEKEQALARAQTQLITDGVAQKMAQVRDACINNLRQIDGAKQQWALETGKTASAEPRKEDLQPYFPNQQFPVCPGSGVYKLNAVGAHPTCSLQSHTLGQ